MREFKEVSGIVEKVYYDLVHLVPTRSGGREENGFRSPSGRALALTSPEPRRPHPRLAQAPSRRPGLLLGRGRGRGDQSVGGVPTSTSARLASCGGRPGDRGFHRGRGRAVNSTPPDGIFLVSRRSRDTRFFKPKIGKGFYGPFFLGRLPPAGPTSSPRSCISMMTRPLLRCGTPFPRPSWQACGTVSPRFREPISSHSPSQRG